MNSGLKVQLSQFDKGFNNQIGRATAYYMKSFKMSVPTAPPNKKTHSFIFISQFAYLYYALIELFTTNWYFRGRQLMSHKTESAYLALASVFL